MSLQPAGIWRTAGIMSAAIVLVLLAGCMYPDELRKENLTPPGEYISVVQQAVDEFYKYTGVLPIKNSAQDTPVYEKYVIDFRKLRERNFLSLIPPNAFENGGHFYYVLVSPENHPQVKLMDIAAFRQAADIEKTVQQYRTRHNGQLPAAGQAYEGLFWVDFAKMSVKRIQVQSPYTRTFLNLLVDEAGRVYIDYAPDLANMMQKTGSSTLKPGQDLRAVLVEHSFFVPVRSVPYELVNNEPYAVLK